MEWIKIEEAKPPNRTYVLVYVQCNITGMILIGRRIDDVWIDDADGSLIDPGIHGRITHWMLLPEAPHDH